MTLCIILFLVVKSAFYEIDIIISLFFELVLTQYIFIFFFIFYLSFFISLFWCGFLVDNTQLYLLFFFIQSDSLCL